MAMSISFIPLPRIRKGPMADPLNKKLKMLGSARHVYPC